MKVLAKRIQRRSIYVTDVATSELTPLCSDCKLLWTKWSSCCLTIDYCFFVLLTRSICSLSKYSEVLLNSILILEGSVERIPPHRPWPLTLTFQNVITSSMWPRVWQWLTKFGGNRTIKLAPRSCSQTSTDAGENITSHHLRRAR